MRRNVSLIAVVAVTWILVASVYLAGAQYFRTTAWVGSEELVTFIEIDRVWSD